MIKLVRTAGDLKLPVLIDAFPDGDALIIGFSPRNFAKLAMASPQTKTIWAHMGGHHVLDFVMIAKRLPNIWMDCSFSLMYYQNTHILQTILYAIRNLKFQKVMYGSDYPDRSIKESLNFYLNAFKIGGFSQKEIGKIMYQNAKEFFYE